jgi:hypothetical protein
MLFTDISSPLTTVFTFSALPTPLPTRTLKFKRRPTHRLSPKRSRPVADVDDGTSASKKKRRLRLHLITSRLSHPFSTPATHIVDPGTSKIAVWAKQRHLTQQVLRKAAIMNRVRRKTLERKDSGISVGEDERREAREAVLEDMGARDVVAAGLGPNAVGAFEEGGTVWKQGDSVLGLSNYDALDEEEDWYDRYHDEDGDEDEDRDSALPASPRSTRNSLRDVVSEKSYYTDWNLRDADADDEDDDPLVSASCLSSIPAELVSDKRPPSPPEGRMAELLREKERQQEILSGFLHFA